MQHFNFSLSAWTAMGLTAAHLAHFSDSDTLLVFGMQKTKIAPTLHMLRNCCVILEQHYTILKSRARLDSGSCVPIVLHDVILF